MYTITREVGNSHVGPDGRLTLGAAVDFMQDCSGFQLDSETEVQKYFKEKNITMFLVSRQINFHKPVFYGETVDVITTVYQLKNSYGFRNTNIYDKEGNVRISSYAGGAFIDLNQMKATAVPHEIVAAVPIDEKFQGMTYLPRKIRLPEDADPEILDEVKVCRYHIDINRHMNNSKYIQIAGECLPEDYKYSTVRIEYRTAAKYGDIMIPYRYSCKDDIEIISLRAADGDIFANIEFRSDNLS
ncbi:MAG: thioesterase [Firmicutes bacterium]|nr:thioesterase [Bacillota bacterium]